MNSSKITQLISRFSRLLVFKNAFQIRSFVPLRNFGTLGIKDQYKNHSSKIEEVLKEETFEIKKEKQ